LDFGRGFEGNYGLDFGVFQLLDFGTIICFDSVKMGTFLPAASGIRACFGELIN
jgi:hypothetical protein